MKAYNKNQESSSDISATNLHIVKNFKLKRYNCIPHTWGQLYTEDGKELSRSALEVLWTLCRFAIYRKSQEIELDYAFLKRECGLFRSHDQIKRYLNDISSTGLMTCKIKRALRGYAKTLYVKIDFLKIDSLGTCLSEGMFTPQVCRANLRTYNKDKNNIKNIKEKENIDVNVDIVKEKKKVEVIEFTKEPCARFKKRTVFRKEAKIFDVAKKIVQNIKPSGINEGEETKISLMIPNIIPLDDTPNASLYKEILRNFPPKEAAKVLKHCKFKITEPGKIEIKVDPEIALEEQDKDRIRTCIKSVYGENIKIFQKKEDITNHKMQQQAKVLSMVDKLAELKKNGNVQIEVEIVDKKNDAWQKIRKDLISSRYNEAIDKVWFSKLEAKISEPNRTITLTSPTKLIEDWIRNNYLGSIEETAKLKGYNIDLIEIPYSLK